MKLKPEFRHDCIIHTCMIYYLYLDYVSALVDLQTVMLTGSFPDWPLPTWLAWPNRKQYDLVVTEKMLKKNQSTHICFLFLVVESAENVWGQREENGFHYITSVWGTWQPKQGSQARYICLALHPYPLQQGRDIWNPSSPDVHIHPLCLCFRIHQQRAVSEDLSCLSCKSNQSKDVIVTFRKQPLSADKM